MSELRLFLPISKVDVEQRLVYGVLTEECVDKSGEIFDYASGKPAVQAWSDEISRATKGKSKGNVRAMHDKIAAGKFTDIIYDDANKRIEGAAKIVDDAEWEKCKEGLYSGFSIGGSYTKRWQDPDNPTLWRFTPELSEISLVDNPCVPTATFEYIKADGSVEMRKFTPSHKEDSMDPKALAKEALAKGTATDEQKALLAEETAALLKAAQEAEAKGEATDEQKALVKSAADEAAKVILVKDGKPVKPKTAPVQDNAWVAPTDGSRHATKREAEVHELHLEKQAELAPALVQMDALLKGAKKPAEDDDEDAEGDDEDTKAAKKERREKKAKDKAEKDDAEMAAKAKKEKEDAEKGATDELAKKAAKDAADKAAALAKQSESPAETLRKGLHQIGWMASLLSDLQCLQGSVEFEQMWEQDEDSELPAKFKSLVSEMCEVLVALVDEETKELIEGDDTDVEILEMAAGLPAGHADALGKFVAKMTPFEEVALKKPEIKALARKFVAFKDALEKAGARHSKVDAERVQALQDHAADVQKCFGAMAEKCAGMHKAAGDAKNTAIDLGAKGERYDGEDDMDPANKSAVKMSKLYEQLNAKTDEVLAVSKVAAASNETLLKAIPLIEGLQTQVGTLREEKSELVKRMEHLEKQPAAPKGHVRAVSKTQDNGGADGETEAECKARMAKMTPNERNRELMKLAMSNPMELPAL